MVVDGCCLVDLKSSTQAEKLGVISARELPSSQKRKGLFGMIQYRVVVSTSFTGGLIGQ